MGYGKQTEKEYLAAIRGRHQKAARKQGELCTKQKFRNIVILSPSASSGQASRRIKLFFAPSKRLISRDPSVHGEIRRFFRMTM
jgi:hypothetical protein